MREDGDCGMRRWRKDVAMQRREDGKIEEKITMRENGKIEEKITMRENK